ncbi:hypothetical protein JRT4AKPX_JRT4AKP_01215 [Klebsiella pneumoniae]|nr:hypothetical protein JRT4AKPX_JRT4AKP_01215 [Klebsiella pneumoniae]
MTRFARRYSAHPWASPLRGQRRRCSKTLPAFLSGQPAYCVRGLSNWLRQLSNPGRGFSSPRRVPHAKKKPVLAYELFLRYGGEGGIDSLRSPLRGSPLTACAVCPTGCASCRTPVGGSHPPRRVAHAKKKPVLAYELFLKYGGEGGIDSLRSPLRGSPLTACAVCPTGCASCRTPVGGSHPPCGEYKRKEPVLAYRLSSRIWR